MRPSIFFGMQVCDTTLQAQVAKVCKVNFVFTPTIQTPFHQDGFLQTPDWSAVLLEMGRCVCVCVAIGVRSWFCFL